MKGLCQHCNRHYQRLDRHNKRFHFEKNTFVNPTSSSSKHEHFLNNAENLVLFLRSNDEKHLKRWLKKKASKKYLLQLFDILISAQNHNEETRSSRGNANAASDLQKSAHKHCSPIFKWIHKLIKKFRLVLLQYSSPLYNLLKIL